MHHKTILTLACVTAIVGMTSVADGAGTMHHSRAHEPAPRCRHPAKHHRSCSYSTRRRHPMSPSSKVPIPTTTVQASTPTSSNASTPPSPKTEPTPTPACPKSTPLPTRVADQATIVGYAWISGGASDRSTCLGDVSAPATVALETTSGQVLQSQTLEAGQPYDFVVRPGEYEIADTLCMTEHLVDAQEGQQTVAEIGCNIA